MRQRVMIAASLIGNPDFLIAVGDIHTQAHPYTNALLQARPRPGVHGGRLPTIAQLLPEGWQDA